MVGPGGKAQGTPANVTSTPEVSQHDKDNTQPGATINRKKQKRRAKEAAKRAQEQEHDQDEGDISTLPPLTAPNGQPLTAPGSFPDANDDETLQPSADNQNQPGNRREPGAASEDDGIFVEQESQQPGKSKKKKKKGKSQGVQDGLDHSQYDPKHPSQRLSPRPLAISKHKKSSEDRIWNTSSAQERERIKDFWLQLKEEQRRSLVKVEKDAVLKKMKEQQKHSCSCTVCGRKRAAIEDELEVLYDAYYRELEQFANHQHPAGTTRQLMPPPQKPLPLNPRSHQPHNHPPNIPPPNRPTHTEPLDDDEEDDEDAEEVYDEDDGSQIDDAYLEDDYLNEPTGAGSEFYEFGNSLTVQDGILTVADDLMQNDGKKFIEMMEQLAERRMQREDDPQYPGVSFRHGRRTTSYPDDDVDSQDDGYGPSDDESYDEDEEDVETMATMTEDQRMEEGRRMFQIFAARMFEQRVLTAYREQIARERQEKLLQELDDDEKANTQRELKKAKEAQKRKEKKLKSKQAKEEDRARKEAEKAAAEAEAKAVEEAKAEEQRKRKEEQRKKKEAEKRAQDEEKQKREAERQRKLQEAREQQAEAERKQREMKEREKKKREDAARKEREAKEMQEAEEARKRESSKVEIVDTHSKAPVQQPTPAPPVAVPVPNLVSRKSNVGLSGSLGSSQTGPSPISSLASPRPQIATPVMPKASLPVRSRQTTQNLEHESRSTQHAPVAPRANQPTSPAHLVTENASHVDALTSRSSPAQTDPRSGQVRSTAYSPSQPTLSPTTTASTLSMHTPIGFTTPMNGQMPNLPPKLGMSEPPPGLGAPPGLGYKNFTAPVVRMPPGLNGIRGPTSQSPTTGSAQVAPPGQGYGYDVMGQQSIDSAIHSSNPPLPRTRHSIDSEAQLAGGFPRFSPISRPQPASIGHGRKTSTAKNDVNELTEQLGSSALIGDDDEDDPLPTSKPAFYDHHSSRFPPSQPGLNRNGVPSSLLSTSVGQDSFGGLKHDALRSAPVGGHWSSHPAGFPNAPVSGSWNSNQGFMKPSNFSMLPPGNVARPVLIRQLACQACRQLSASSPQSNGYHFISTVLQVTQQLKPVDPPIEGHELLDIFDTEGNSQNGGGAFFVLDQNGSKFVRWTPENQQMSRRLPSGPGEIGSPVIGGSMPFGFGKQFGPPGSLPTPPSY